MGSVAIPSGGGGTGIPKDITITTYTNLDGSQPRTISCEIGDAIVVYGTAGAPSATGATLIETQTSSAGAGGIFVATSSSVTLSWYGIHGNIKVIHTDRLKRSSYTIEKARATAMSSKNITNLKVGDLIVGNASDSGSAYNDISNITNAASLDGSHYFAQPFMAIRDTVRVNFSGSTANYTIVAFRQR